MSQAWWENEGKYKYPQFKGLEDFNSGLRHIKIIQLREWNGWLIGLSDTGFLYNYRWKYGQDKEGNACSQFIGWEAMPTDVIST